MALKCEHVVRDEPVAVSPAARTQLLAFFSALGISPAAAVELRVWFEGPSTLDPRDGALTAQVSRVQKSEVVAGAPQPGVFNIVDE